MNIEEEVLKILKEDPLNILTSKKATNFTVDERILSSFEDIKNFYKKESRLPESSEDIIERKLFNKLNHIRNDPDLRLSLAKYDEFNFLNNSPDENSTSNIIQNDYLGLLNDEESDIFDLSNLPSRAKPEDVSKRKKCENFEVYEPLFKEVHHKLETGQIKLIPFSDKGISKGESHLKPKSFFVLKGLIVYLEDMDSNAVREFNDKNKGNSERIDSKTTCIFENGTMSNMYLRSLQKQLYENGKTLVKVDADSINNITEEDKFSGYIYVLKSKSDDVNIKSIKNLYKIGFSKNSVQQRIQNAANDPTYLMSNVEIILTYKCFNLDAFKFEQIIHNLFVSRRLNIEITDKSNQVKKPKEWYILPLETIDKAINLILTNEIKNYKFDNNSQMLILS